MKRLLIPLLGLLITAFIITGCSTSTPTPSTPAASQPATTTPIISAPPTTTTKPTTTAPTATAPPTTTTTAPSTAASTTQTAAVKYGGTMKYITAQGISSPIGYTPEVTGSSIFSMQVAMQGMIREQADGSFTPTLATSWDINPDPNNPSITWHLRKGVKFHDGTDFNAQAVAWTLQNTKASPLNIGTTQYWKSFEVLDDYTIKVNFTVWQNRLQRSFADTVGFIISPKTFDKNGIDWMRWHMVGTGPFMQTDFQRDVSLTTTKNSNYWDQGKPYHHGIQILYVADQMTRTVLFQSGGGNIVELNPHDANLLQNSGYKIMSQNGGAAALIPDSLNADSPWSNAKVRLAADYAIDKAGMAKTFGYGFWQPAYQLNPPNTAGFDSSLPGRLYDVAKAKQLLAEAGYPNGFKTQIIAQNNTDQNILSTIQANLASVGIQAQLEIVEAAKMTAYNTGTWNNGLIYSPLLQWPNPNTAFAFFFGVPNSTYFKSLKKPDNWLSLATASMTAPKMDPALIQKCEDAFYNDATIIPLFYSVSLWGVSSNLQGDVLGTRGYGTYWNPDNAWLK